MEISHIEHIGIAVTSLDEAIPFYENILGFKCFAIEEVEDQKVRTAFFQVGPTKIELLEATAPESAIAKFIEKNGGRGGIQHVAFAVESGVANALEEVQDWKICLGIDECIDSCANRNCSACNAVFLPFLHSFSAD